MNKTHGESLEVILRILYQQCLTKEKLQHVADAFVSKQDQQKAFILKLFDKMSG